MLDGVGVDAFVVVALSPLSRARSRARSTGPAATPSPVCDRPMPNRSDDDPAPLDRVQDSVAARGRGPDACQTADERRSQPVRLESDECERREHGFADALWEFSQPFLGKSRESKLRQARARASPRRD